MKKEQHIEKADEKEDGKCFNLEPGWNRINANLWAVRSRTMEYQDTTLVPAALVPADMMLWFRSTLLKIGDRWQLEEFPCFEASGVLTLGR